MQYYRNPGPWASNEERLITEALEVGSIPAVVIQETVRPPLPQIKLFPPRFGYGNPPERVPGIDLVLGAYRYYPDNKDAFSGGTAAINSSSRNSLGSGTW